MNRIYDHIIIILDNIHILIIAYIVLILIYYIIYIIKYPNDSRNNLIKFLEGVTSIFYNLINYLGNFDGFFLYKGLLSSKLLDINKVESIIDDKNKFILIKYTPKNDISFTWKDSYRLFPIPLQELCNLFKVKGKTSKYKSEYNDISLFDDINRLNEFLEYCPKDKMLML